MKDPLEILRNIVNKYGSCYCPACCTRLPERNKEVAEAKEALKALENQHAVPRTE